MTEISIWVSIVSGIATIIGVIFGFYKIRIKNASSSDAQKTEWAFALKNAFALGILITSSILFYNQQRPGIRFLTHVHDFIHGKNFKWEEKSYSFNEQEYIADVVVDVREVIITDKQTILKLYLPEKSLKKDNLLGGAAATGSSSEYDKFADMKKQFADLYIENTRGKPLSIEDISVRYDLGVECNCYLYFPSIKGTDGDISLFSFYRDKDNNLLRKEYASLSIIPDGNGSSIWALLIALSIFFMSIIDTNYVSPFKNKLIPEGREIRKAREEELEKILRRRKYSELEPEEKKKYDDVENWYSVMQKKSLEVGGNRKETKSPNIP